MLTVACFRNAEIKNWHRHIKPATLTQELKLFLPQKSHNQQGKEKLLLLTCLCFAEEQPSPGAHDPSKTLMPWWWGHENWLQHRNSFSWDKGDKSPYLIKKLATLICMKLNLNITTLVFTWSTNFFFVPNVCPWSYASKVPLLGKWNQTRNSTANAVFLWKPFALCFWLWR